MHNTLLEKAKNLLKLHFAFQFCPPLKSDVRLIQILKMYKMGYKNIHQELGTFLFLKPKKTPFSG